MVVAGLLQNFSAFDDDNSIARNYNDDILTDEDMYVIDQCNLSSHCNQGGEDNDNGGLPCASRIIVTPTDLSLLIFQRMMGTMACGITTNAKSWYCLLQKINDT